MENLLSLYMCVFYVDLPILKDPEISYFLLILDIIKGMSTATIFIILMKFYTITPYNYKNIKFIIKGK